MRIFAALTEQQYGWILKGMWQSVIWMRTKKSDKERIDWVSTEASTDSEEYYIVRGRRLGIVAYLVLFFDTEVKETEEGATLIEEEDFITTELGIPEGFWLRKIIYRAKPEEEPNVYSDSMFFSTREWRTQSNLTSSKLSAQPTKFGTWPDLQQLYNKRHQKAELDNKYIVGAHYCKGFLDSYYCVNISSPSTPSNNGTSTRSANSDPFQEPEIPGQDFPEERGRTSVRGHAVQSGASPAAVASGQIGNPQALRGSQKGTGISKGKISFR